MGARVAGRFTLGIGVVCFWHMSDQDSSGAFCHPVLRISVGLWEGLGGKVGTPRQAVESEWDTANDGNRS